MKPLEPPDTHHLSAALGWLGLGNWREAIEDLEKISPKNRGHSDVLLVRYEVYSKAADWNAASEVARQLIDLHPAKSQFWIWHAYAQRRMAGGGIPQAKAILQKAEEFFPKEPLIRYNLGCYDCQMGNLDSAWQWLEKAFALGNARNVKSMALQDVDLEPLWPKIQQYKPLGS